MRTYRLEDDTCGTSEDIYEIGEEAEVLLHDENGNQISVVGIIAEILD